MNPLKDIPRDKLIIALLAGAVIYMLYLHSRNDHGGKLPGVSDAAQAAIVELAQEQARMRRAMSDALRRGQVTSDQQYWEWFNEQRPAAEERAYRTLEEMEQSEIGRLSERDQFNTLRAAEFCDAVAEGFERVK